MKKEIALLNLICVVAAIGLVAFALMNAVLSGDFLSIDNLFITAVFLVLALVFVANPLLYLKSEGKLPIPFKRGARWQTTQLATSRRASIEAAVGQALLDDMGGAGRQYFAVLCGG